MKDKAKIALASDLCNESDAKMSYFFRAGDFFAAFFATFFAGAFLATFFAGAFFATFFTAFLAAFFATAIRML
jgi:hypothetical protein